MAYLHIDCGGKVKWYPFLPIRPRCLKCGQTWSPSVVYSAQPKDLYYIFEGPKLSITKGSTDYANWADRSTVPPGVTLVASNLPNWPRKWRIVSFFGSISLLSGAFYGLYLLSIWAVILGAIGFGISPIIIIAIMLKIRGGKGLDDEDSKTEDN